MKRPRWILIGILFVVSIFLGFAIFTSLSVAFNPSITNITKPILCSSGEQTIEVVQSSYRPGENRWSVFIYCDGKDITPQAVILTGLMATLVFFVILLVVARNMLFGDKPLPATMAGAGLPAKGKGKTPLERMAELKEMRDKNLISQVEYERKKDEIMKEL